MANYYENVYAKVTVPDFQNQWTNNTEAQAWREDAGASLSSAFGDVVDDIDADMSTLSVEIDETFSPPSGPGLSEYDTNSGYKFELERP